MSETSSITFEKVRRAIELRNSTDSCALARAAIEAMRDPPDEVMLAPGIPYYGSLPMEQGIEYRRKAWNVMIDKVLS